MSAARPTSAVQFMTIPEGAARLGISGLRLREAALRGAVPSQHDNQGRLRVDLTGLRALPELPENAAPLQADEVLDLLFDEVEDLQLALDTKEHEVSRLSDLVARQGQAIEVADKALTAPTLPEAVDAARTQAELTGLLDRAMALLEHHASGDADQKSRTDTRREAAKSDAERLATTTRLLERALAVADRLQTEADEAAQRQRDNDETTQAQLARALALSERAVETALAKTAAPVAKREGLSGLLARIFGR